MVSQSDPDRQRTGASDGPSPRRIKRITISAVLAISIGSLILLAAGSVTVVSWWTNIKNLQELSSSRAIMAAEMVEQEIRSHLEPAWFQLAFLAGLIERGSLDPEDTEVLVQTLTGSLAAMPQVRTVIFIDRGFRQTGVIQNQEDRAYEVETNVLLESPQAIALVERVRDMGEPLWGNIVYSPDAQRSFVNLVWPLYRGSAFLGALVAAVSTAELSRNMEAIGETFDAVPFILQSGARVVAHPFLVDGHPELSLQSPLVTVDRIGDFVLSELWSGELLPAFDIAARQGVEVRELTIGDLTYLTLHKVIPGFSDSPWLIGLWFPFNDVGQALQRSRIAAAITLAALIIAVLLALALGHLLARPVHRLAAVARQVAGLELRQVHHLPASNIRELDEQASAFNAMVAGLRWFEMYVPRTLVMRLMGQGHFGELHSEERELTVMFTDIVGFTTLSERMTAAETATLLNEHFALLAACVEAEGGTIDKFIGDGLMAFWGAPETQPDTALRACRSALAIAEAIATDNRRRRESGTFAVRIRIGIHTGPVVVGNIGAPGRMNYTIVGDTVNTGQRLENLGRDLMDDRDVTILVSSDTAASIAGGGLQLESIGSFQVKGRQQSVEVYHLQGQADRP